MKNALNIEPILTAFKSSRFTLN